MGFELASELFLGFQVVPPIPGDNPVGERFAMAACQARQVFIPGVGHQPGIVPGKLEKADHHPFGFVAVDFQADYTMSKGIIYEQFAGRGIFTPGSIKPGPMIGSTGNMPVLATAHFTGVPSI
jgi:hypothetical protein